MLGALIGQRRCVKMECPKGMGLRPLLFHIKEKLMLSFGFRIVYSTFLTIRRFIFIPLGRIGVELRYPPTEVREGKRRLKDF
jgi:hypothetical protein